MSQVARSICRLTVFEGGGKKHGLGVLSSRAGEPFDVRKMRPVRIVYVTGQWSATPASAAEVRTLNIARALQQVGEVKVVEVADDGGYPRQPTPPEFELLFSSPCQAVSERGVARKVNWLLNARTLVPHGVGVSECSTLRLRRAAANADLIWFCKLRTANMFRVWAWPHSVVDVDDVPSLFERSVRAATTRIGEQLQSALRQWSWSRRERLLGERFSTIAVCSPADKWYLEQIGVRAPVHVIANGFERSLGRGVRRPATPPRIGFIGVFDHAPNVEGIQWFVRECWPVIKREIPDVRLRLVGRMSDGRLKPDGVDIDALGLLPDPTEEMSTWSLMIVPIRTGAGTRGKIAHGFSQKCPIVATPLGAYGYEDVTENAILLAESYEAFAGACIRLVRTPELGAAMAECAWRDFLERWTWEAIQPRIIAAAEDTLRRAGGPVERAFATNEINGIDDDPRGEQIRNSGCRIRR